MDDPIDDSNSNNDSEKTIPFPGHSIFEKRTKCGIQMIYYPKIDAYFWREWEFSPAMPISVLTLISTSFIVLVSLVMPYFYWECLIIPLQILLLVMYIYSYIQIIRVGPGYFPYYWGAQDLAIDITTETLLNHNFPPQGIMTSEEQYQWGHVLPMPPRSKLAHSARRIVLRPDHLCGWTTVWIGKRNHKMFILFNFYGLLYTLMLSFYSIRRLVVMFTNLSGVLSIIIVGFYGFLSLTFTLVHIIFLYSGLHSAFINQTSWEEWNNFPPNTYDRGRQKNLEDVFGKWNGVCDCLCPTDPFSQFTNEDLAAEYN